MSELLTQLDGLLLKAIPAAVLMAGVWIECEQQIREARVAIYKAQR